MGDGRFRGHQQRAGARTEGAGLQVGLRLRAVGAKAGGGLCADTTGKGT